MTEHTKGLLRVGRPGAVVADHPVPEMSGSDAVEFYGGHLVAESITPANARRIVACWNACHGLPTDELEQNGLASAFGNQLLQVEQQRDALQSTLEWTDEQIMEFISMAFRHAQIKGDFELSDVREALNMIKARAMSNLEGEQS